MAAAAQPPQVKHIVGGRYQLLRMIGYGSFGLVYLAKDVVNGEEFVVKLESVCAAYPQLDFENRVYKALEGGTGIPRTWWFGRWHGYKALVMERLGPSLEDLFNFCGRRFTLKTVFMLFDQMIQRLEYIHSKYFIHRDLKPQNILMGVQQNYYKVYLIDFGLAKKFQSDKVPHMPFRDDKRPIGTARYASARSHLGAEISRRDDMESLGYIFLYFLRGSLPWQDVKAVNKQQKMEMVKERKLSTSIFDLCKGYPIQFHVYLDYCRNLMFEQKPDYEYLRKLFSAWFQTMGLEMDYKYDWCYLKTKESPKKVCI